MAHSVVCEAYFLGCELFLQMCFFPVMHSVILPRNDTLHYFEESQGTLQTINNFSLQIYGRKKYRFIYRLKIPDVGPRY